jgi:hypothetical protein
MTTKQESPGRSVAAQYDLPPPAGPVLSDLWPYRRPPRCSHDAVWRGGARRDRREESAMQARSRSRIVGKGHHAGESDL